MTEKLLDTKYQKTIGYVSVSVGPKKDEEARLERIYVKELGTEEIRFSWWKNGNMAPRPLDIEEHVVWRLIGLAIGKGLLCQPPSDNR